MVMASLSFHHPRLRFFHNLPKPHLQCPTPANYPKITCGLRAGPRKALWRSRVLSTEAIQAIQSLKLAKSASKLEEVFSGRLSRLLKADLLDVLTELRRQNELELALQVFKFVRKEVWYKPDLSLYCDMIMLLGKNNLIEMAEEFFSELKKESLEPDSRAFTEMIGAYIRVGMIDKAMEMYTLMKESGVAPDRLTFKILIRNLQGCGEDELAAVVKRDCVDYVDSPEKFIEEVEKRQIKRRSPSSTVWTRKAQPQRDRSIICSNSMEYPCDSRMSRASLLP